MESLAKMKVKLEAMTVREMEAFEQVKSSVIMVEQAELEKTQVKLAVINLWPRLTIDGAQWDSALPNFLVATCMVCPLAPSPDELSNTAADIRTTQRWLISISVANHHILTMVV